MADIKFPNSPTVGQIYIDTTTLYHYQWTGDSWIAFTSGLTSAIPGPQGPTGPAAGFSNTQVTYDLPAGSAARVDVDPLSPDTAKVFRFGIPAGQQGIKGDIGPQGPDGPMGPQGIQGPQGKDAPIFEFAGIRHNVANSAVLDAVPVPNPYKPVVLTLIYDGTDPTPDPDDPALLRFAKGEVEMWVYAPGPYSKAGISTFATLPGDKRGDWVSLGAIKPVKGDDGLQGPMGPQGNNGAKGDKGDTGAQGPAGPTGAQGLTGLQGNKGDKGDKGDTGPAGTSLTLKGVIPGGAWGTVAPPGVIGELWISGGDITGFPVNGVPTGKTVPAGHGISWDGTEWDDLGSIKGPKGDQGQVGPQGPAGATGPTGPQGPIGATGLQGPKGDKGDKGDTGSAGPVGPPGPFLIGMITAWGGGTAPAGWLECNGQSTAAYPQLGTIVGAAVPDLRGEFIRGWDHGRGVDAGRSIRSYQADEFMSHSHDYSDRTNENTGGGQGGGGAWTSTTTIYKTTNSAGGPETRPRNVALMYIIKHD